MRPSRAMMVLVAIALPMAPLTSIPASASPRAAALSTKDVLPGNDSGPEALIALGDAVDATAAQNGMSTKEFTKVLKDDKTAHLDTHGQMYYVDPAAELSGPALPGTASAQVIAAGSAALPAGVSVATSGLQVPQLSSRPASTHKIYLDFDGYTLPATSAWATATSNPIPGNTTYKGFSLDSSPDFTAAEIAFIEKVQAIVAEKYAPFDVDVTTVDPGQDALVRTGSTNTDRSDTAYGVHVVITDDRRPVQAICGGTCAGIAYTNVFDRINNATYSPAWVFSSNTYRSAQITAHDAAHEIGHTFGLHHDGAVARDGIPATGYYQGHDNWVPIMGITNQQAVAQFSKGEYPGANNAAQDDLAVIGANGPDGSPGSLHWDDGYPNRGDGVPTMLTGSTGYAANGVISDAADNDAFEVVWPCSTPMSVTATGIGSGQSVDLKLSVLNAASQVIETDDPGSGQRSVPDDIGYAPTGMDAALSIDPATAVQGEGGVLYGIWVEGVGHGTGTTGYTDYGSIGQYRLEVSGCPALGQPNAPGPATATQNPRTAAATISWTEPATTPGSQPATGYRITGLPGGTVTVGNQLQFLATGLLPGTYPLKIQGLNSNGAGPAATTTLVMKTFAPTTAPVLTGAASGTTAVLRWTAPANPGKATTTGWRVRGSGPGNTFDYQVAANVGTFTISGLPIGTFTFNVTGLYTATDTGGVVPSNTVSVRVYVKPSAPRIGLASPGTRGRPVTATVRWSAPASTGGAAITSYRLYAYKLSSTGAVVRTITSPARPASARSYVWRLAKARYKFRVVAYNAAGASPYSAYSRVVAAR